MNKVREKRVGVKVVIVRGSKSTVNRCKMSNEDYKKKSEDVLRTLISKTGSWSP